MSRRSQARRRRNYGRRQHEVRERRPSRIEAGWVPELTDPSMSPAVETDGAAGSNDFGSSAP